MFATLRNVVMCFAALLALNVSVLAEDFVPRMRPTLRPVEPVRLGFVGHVDRGEGMHVERVLYGSIADQIGLEAGDLIERINGQRIRCNEDYFDAIRNAFGVFNLVVHDVRTGHHNTLRFRVVSGRVRFDEECDHGHHHHDEVYYSSPTLYRTHAAPEVRIGVGGGPNLNFQVGRVRISSHP